MGEVLPAWTERMTHIAEDDRAVGRCDGCGNIYTVRLSSAGGIEPIGVPAGCTTCGGTEFTVLGRTGDRPSTS